MSGYPPKLIAVAEAPFGSVLTLDDGSAVPLDVRPARLAEVLREYLEDDSGFDKLIENRAIGVFVGECRMTAELWTEISRCVRSSSDAAVTFCRYPSLWECFGEPLSIIAAKPHRLYGGVSRFLYTSHPLDFRPDRNRPLPWYRALLSAPGGWLFTTWVNTVSGEVDIESDQMPGHHVE